MFSNKEVVAPSQDQGTTQAGKWIRVMQLDVVPANIQERFCSKLGKTLDHSSCVWCR